MLDYYKLRIQWVTSFLDQSFAEQSLSQKLLLSYRSAADNPKSEVEISTAIALLKLSLSSG